MVKLFGNQKYKTLVAIGEYINPALVADFIKPENNARDTIARGLPITDASEPDVNEHEISCQHRALKTHAEKIFQENLTESHKKQADLLDKIHLEKDIEQQCYTGPKREIELLETTHSGALKQAQQQEQQASQELENIKDQHKTTDFLMHPSSQTLYGITLLLIVVGAIVNSFTFAASTNQDWAGTVVQALSIDVAMMALSFIAGHVLWGLFQGNGVYKAISVLLSVFYLTALGLIYLNFAMMFGDQLLVGASNWAFIVVGIVFCVLTLIVGMTNRAFELGYSNAFQRHKSAQAHLNASVESYTNMIRKHIEPYLEAPRKQYDRLCEMMNEYAEQVTAEGMAVNWYSRRLEEINESYHYSVRKYRDKIEELSNDPAPDYFPVISKPFDAKELLAQMNYPTQLEEKEQRVQSFEDLKSELREQIVNVKHKLYDLRQSAIKKVE